MIRNFRSIVVSRRGLSTKSDLHNIIMSMSTSRANTKKPAKKNYPASYLNLQVVGSGAHGVPASLYVAASQTRYLFNCGEGTQRLAYEHKIKLAKLEHIFFTKSSWKNLGGLPGLCLTLRDAGVSSVTLHGPSQIDDIFHTSKSFIALGDLKLTRAPLHEPYEDNVMTVHNVLIDCDNPYLYEDVGDEESILTAKRPCTHAPGSDQSVAYICKLHPKKGMLQFEKCIELGVPLGPLLGKLKAGNNVTLHDGTHVLASDVTSPDDPGPIFIVVECPDESYLSSLVAKEEFVKHQMGGTEDVASAVFHFTPPHVLRLPQYQQWMNRFPTSTTHLTINSDNACQGTIAVHRLQHKLHLLHKDIFPLLKERPKVSPVGSAVHGNTLVKFNIRPNTGIDLTSLVTINPEEYVQETMDEEGFEEELEQLKKKLAIADVKGQPYPRITFLGTGSCIPNKTRNTSGILVETKEDCCFLMDCGEATASQMIRMFGLEQTNKIMRCLKGVYVSHLHADHHVGLVGVILARLDAFKEAGAEASKLILLLPQPVIPFISAYSRTYENISEHVEIVKLNDNGNSEYDKFKAALDLKDFKTCFVKHCGQSFGVMCEHTSGWKLVYSGDTEPCDRLIEIGKGCDLLIHEATLEDGLENEARMKKHSTTSEAIQVGRDMEAKFTLLTHFSQRYAKIPLYTDKFSETVGIAFDNMQISLSQVHLLPIIMSTMRKMFNKYHEEMEQKIEMRNLRNLKREKIEEKLKKKQILEAFSK